MRPYGDRGIHFARLALACLAFSPFQRSAVADGFDLTGLTAMDGSAAGTTALPWLRLPVGARNVALGGHSLTTDEDASAQIANPAAVTLAQHPDYALSHAEILGEFRLEHLCLAMPWRFGGHLGLTLGALFTGQFDYARTIDEEEAHPSASDLLAGAAFGRSFFEDRLAFGIRLDLYRSAIEEVSAYGGGLGLGSTLSLGMDWRLALALRHLGPGMAYNTPGSEMQTQPMLWNVEIGKPMALDGWSAQAGAEQDAGGVLRYYGGGEWLFRDLLLFRGGYEGSTQDHELGLLTGLSAGLGVRWDAVTIDYGFKYLGLLGSYHAVGLSYSRKLKDRRSDDFLLKKAQASYAEGDYHRALKLTRKALNYNPRNYKAQAFLSIVLADLERLDDRAVSLLFTANTRGNLAPQWVAGKPLGGLARRAAKLIELRQSYPNHALVDAGDLWTATTQKETGGFLTGAYARMDYDAIGVGPQEMLRAETALAIDLPWVASQDPWDKAGSGVKDVRVKKMPGGIRVLTLAVAADAPGIESTDAALDRGLKNAKDKDLVVVLWHGSLQQAYLAAKKRPRIDVIVLSGESGAMAVPMQAGNTLLVCPGSDGVYLGQLSFVFDKNGGKRKFNHRLIPLDIKVPEDAAMARLLSSAIVDLNQTLWGDGELELTAKALPFIDDTTSQKGRLNFVDIITGKAYGHGSGGLPVSDPAVAWGRNRVAFASGTENGPGELYAVSPGHDTLDTLTRGGGRASSPVFGLRGKAVFCLYEKDGVSDLMRVDPWRHEMNNLTQGRLGYVHAFALSPQQDRLIFAARLGGDDILTLAGSDLSSPMEIARESAIIGRVAWSPDGERFAYLKGGAGDTTGEIRVYDTRLKGLISLAAGNAVHEMAFSADSKRLYYSAGNSVADLNVAHLDSLTFGKATQGGNSPRSERFPHIRYVDGKEALLFLSEDREGRHLIYRDTESGQEKELVAPRPGLRLR